MLRHLPLRAQVTPGGLSERERDAALADGIAGGDRDSLEAVFKDVSGAVKTTAWLVLRDDSLAEDVVQDVFVTLWKEPRHGGPSRLTREIAGGVVSSEGDVVSVITGA
jgi:hypothetical protein